MINVIWQSLVDSIEHNMNIEFIDKVILKNVEHTNYFDNREYKLFLDNSIIIYSPYYFLDKNYFEWSSKSLKLYLNKYKSLNLNFIFYHLYDEDNFYNKKFYKNMKFVFHQYYDRDNKYSNVMMLPLGFASGYMNKENIINLSDKRDILVSFIGQIKTDRQNLLDNLENIDNKFLHLTKLYYDPSTSYVLSKQDTINIYKKTLFAPCPSGYNIETYRLYEVLEWGCIPIIKKYNGVDYYEQLFGKHPIPIVNDWNELPELMNKLNDKNIDNLILEINIWYKNFMNDLSLKVKNIIEEKL
jgi:hypothetical protein